MNHNFKPGDLAMIVGAFSVTENIGRAVECAVFLAPGEERFYHDGIFEAGPDGLWIVTAPDLYRNCEEGLVKSSLAGCAPQHLRPLRGDVSPEHQQEPQSKYELLDDLEAGMDVRGLPV